MRHIVPNYIDDLQRLFKETKATDLSGNVFNLTDALIDAADRVMRANSLGNKTMFIGNGGSAAVASHKALDYWFTGKIRGLSFSDHANLTCISNDFGYQNVFVKQIEMFADRGDILFAISSSGNSENIVLAVEEARRKGCQIFTFSGFKENNRLRGLGNLNFYVPVQHFNKAESLHLLLCDCILEIIAERRNKFLINNEHVKEEINKFQLSPDDILVAFDRDGTLILDEDGYFGKSEDWREKIRLHNGAARAVKILNSFARVIVASNQIGVARGFYGQDRVKEINLLIASLLREQGAEVQGWYFSPYVEKSWAEKQGLDLNTPWISDGFPETRKPHIGMLRQAAADFGKDIYSYKKIFVIGDSLDDMEMALNAGGIGIFFENGKNNHLIGKVMVLESANPGRIFWVNNLVSAAEMVKLKSAM